MDRRRLLMACLNTGSWEQYSQQYLYYTLIPQTINSKPVKNKAKVSKIYGNGEIVNQLFYPRNSGTPYGVTVTNNGDGSLTFSGQATSDGYPVLNNANDYPLNFVVAHKYLVIGGTSALQLYVGSNTLSSTSIISVTSNTSNFQTKLVSGTTYNETKYIQVIDLTLMFGTGNEPTTLTDNRIQNILNRGYIPYNLGEYKGTDIGEFKSEPYNLFVGTITETNHYLNVSGGTTSDSDCDVSDYYYIKGGVSITLEGANPRHWSNPSICWYDENKNFIGGQKYNGQETIVLTLPTNVCYVRFTTDKTNADICLHRTGTRTGYETHKTFTPITFKYQGNGAINNHDTMEIGKENVVFTKNVSSVDLGSLAWNKYGSNQGVYRTNSDGLPNMLQTGVSSSSSYYLLGNYVENTNDNTFLGTQECIAKELGRLIISIPSATDITTLLQAITGKITYYPLATPQVITIPRKHILLVNLGEQNIQSETLSSGVNYYTDIIANAKASNNCYCSKYLSNAISSGSMRNNIWVSASKRINCTADGFNSIDEFKNAMMGVYVAIETTEEVADITDTIDIESGGTISANWFSWVENQQVSNGNFATKSNWTAYNLVADWSVSDNVATIVVSSFSGSATYGQFYQNISPISNHTYLLVYDIKSNANNNAEWRLGNMHGIVISTATTTTSWNTIYSLLKRTDSASDFGLYLSVNGNTTLPATFYLKNVRYIDLTLAFGSGNEPTSINDARIQKIISKGYIPTNADGTLKSVATEVLPNTDLLIKCK